MATPIPRNSTPLAKNAALLAQAMGGRVLGGVALERDARCVVTDSRSVTRGDVFVALRGERFDGHAHLEGALAAGADILVVEDESNTSQLRDRGAIVSVSDTLSALGKLARGHVDAAPRRPLVVGITGSVGKTTTRAMCAAVLCAPGVLPGAGAQGARVHATSGNLNNRIGLPMTMLAYRDEPALVLEMGMSVPGEIAELTSIAGPDVGIVTSVAEVHTEGVLSLQGVATEKAALLLGLKGDAVGIWPVDDVVIAPLAARSSARTLLSFGFARDADVRVVRREPLADGGSLCTFAVRGVEGETSLRLSLLGAGAARNAAAALALAYAVGGAAALEPAARALETLAPEPGRLATRRGRTGFLLLDDAYNASPRATLNALEAAHELSLARGGRTLAVLGDMLELGALEVGLHRDVGEACAKIGVGLIGLGDRMRHAVDAASAGGADAKLASSHAEACALALEGIAARDVVLVKGSRGMQMEQVADALGIDESEATR